MTPGKKGPRVLPPTIQETLPIHLEDAQVIEHSAFQGGYRLLTLRAALIAPEVRPGQFVHLKIPNLADCLMRRPFSVYQADADRLKLLYKDIGRGTHAMTKLSPGEAVSLIGPLGRPFPRCQAGATPVLVAGGYGMAALYLVARNQSAPGVAFFGGRKAEDILCVEEFEALGWEVRGATEDGSRGVTGMVTGALDAWLREEGRGLTPEFFACGPNAMLRAVADRARAGGWTAWISMDRNMCCGVGACLTCVQKVAAADGGDDWVWARVCREGPVFESREIVWDD